MFDVPFVPTAMRAVPAIAAALAIGTDDVVYELGSGDGRVLCALARQYPAAHFVGIERNPLLHAAARLRVWAYRIQNIELHRGDLFAADLSRATRLYAYLLADVMDRLLPKLQCELCGARLVSRAFVFAGKQALEARRISDRDGPHGEHLLHIYEF